MSATIELTAWQKFHSHVVNCNSCKRDKKKIVHLCKVGALLYARANIEPEKSGKPMSFPFVARIHERVGTPFGEAIVLEKSIQPREMYEKTDWTTGDTTWRTGSDKVIGYEVMTDDEVHHYVRAYQIKSLRVRSGAVPKDTPQLNGRSSQPDHPVPDILGDLIILRRS